MMKFQLRKRYRVRVSRALGRMEALGMSQAELAWLLGVSPSTVARWLSRQGEGVAYPYASGLSAVLGLPLEALILRPPPGCPWCGAGW